MPELTAEAHQLLQAIVAAPVAWLDTGDLARVLGWTLDRTLDTLADLEASGWVQAWHQEETRDRDGSLWMPARTVVTFTPLGAARLGVRLIELPGGFTRDLKAGWLRWTQAAEAEAPAVDDEAEALDLDELAAKPRRRRPLWAEREPPWPYLFLGRPRPGKDPASPCSDCKGRILRPDEVCLSCHRWGRDSQFLRPPH